MAGLPIGGSHSCYESGNRAFLESVPNIYGSHLDFQSCFLGMLSIFDAECVFLFHGLRGREAYQTLALPL